MLIDWFTVGAQIVNFLVLVWLLKRFAYKPILNAIDAREQRIATEQRDAAAAKSAAQKTNDELQEKLRSFEAERAALLAKAVQESGLERERLMHLARQEAQDLSTRGEAAMREARARLIERVMRLATEEVYAIARKVLTDLAGVGIEERLIEAFTHRLRTLDGDSMTAFHTALTAPPATATVCSSAPLSPASRQSVQTALNETFSAAIPLTFITSAATVCGIEVSVAGQKIAWSIADYLSALQQSVGGLLEEAAPSPAAAPAAS